MSDFFQKGLDYQKDFAKKWMDSFQKLNTANIPTADFTALSEWYEKMVSNYQNMMNEWSNKFTAENPFFKVQPWNFNMFQTTEPQFDLFNKIINASKVYTDIYNLYQNLIGKDVFQSNDEIKAFVEQQSGVYEKLAEDMLLPFLPEGSKEFVASAREIAKKIQNLNKDFAAPWLEGLKDNSNNIEKILKGDKNAFNALYQEIVAAYEKSFGKIFNVASLGLTKETNEEFLQNFDSFNKMYIALVQLLGLINEVSKDNMVEMVKRFQDSAKDGKQPKTIKEFLDLYLQINDDAFTKVMGGDEFTTLFTEFSSCYGKFKKESDEIMEKVLGWMPFPKNTEMNNLYKTVYELRKQSYYDHKAIEELKKELHSKKVAASKE